VSANGVANVIVSFFGLPVNEFPAANPDLNNLAPPILSSLVLSVDDMKPATEPVATACKEPDV
jgi:hypothetical protein